MVPTPRRWHFPSRVVYDLKQVSESILLARSLGAACHSTANNNAAGAQGGARTGKKLPPPSSLPSPTSSSSSAEEASTAPTLATPALALPENRFSISNCSVGNGRVLGFGSKLDAIVLELRRLKREDPSVKSLVFSQWSEALLLLREALTANSVASLVLTGGTGAVETLRRFRQTSEHPIPSSSSSSSSSSLLNTRVSKRHHLSTNDDDSPGPQPQDYDDDDDHGAVQVLLMPLKATNAGLSINEATHVFFLDTGLNRGMEIQALARVRRLNSTRATTVHRLVMEGSIEEAIWNLLKQSRQAQQTQAQQQTRVQEGGEEGENTASSSSSSSSSSSLAARPELKRSDVHRMLKRLKQLYQSRGNDGGERDQPRCGDDEEGEEEQGSNSGSGSRDNEVESYIGGLGVQPEWRRKIFQGLLG